MSFFPLKMHVTTYFNGVSPQHLGEIIHITQTSLKSLVRVQRLIALKSHRSKCFDLVDRPS
jgi:hypothetical protein